ncbi:MAG: cation transporter [Hyphomonas sp.]|nr:cation transporter [Hyphomonas sp.]|tara:strand:+ start:3634 stop:4626 length:993 start_codon:yes stop_codon:yes gene_type:complete
MNDHTHDSSDHDHEHGDHGHSHGHSHAHGYGHSHSHDADMTTADSRRRVALAAMLTAAFMGAEIAGGIISGSLALLADAAHMLTDAGSLALAWVGYKLAERPADPQRSYGFARMKILAAFTNGILLVLLSLWIVWEAIQRLLQPVEVMGDVLMAVAVGGLLVNIIAFAILHGGSKEDLNLQGALWHVLGDLLGSVAAIGAAIIIMTTGWMAADPILSVLVAILVLVAGVRIARQSGHILLEGTPDGLSPAEIRADLVAEIDGVAEVTHIHAWALTEHKPLITLEVSAAPGTDLDLLRQQVKARLADRFEVSHATVEVVSAAAEPSGQCSH